MVLALLFRAMSYSRSPIFAVPCGKTRFWLLTALTTSAPEMSPLQELLRIEIDGDQAVLAAVRSGEFRAFDVGELGAEKIDRQVRQLAARKASCCSGRSARWERPRRYRQS